VKYLILISLIFLTACSNTSPTSQGDIVLLYRNGEFKKVEVKKKTGAYCTVAWYESIDNFALKSDGTAIDGVFNYRWTLSEFGNEADKIWFNKNCKDPK
jgi:hypothetical protein